MSECKRNQEEGEAGAGGLPPTQSGPLLKLPLDSTGCRGVTVCSSALGVIIITGKPAQEGNNILQTCFA